MKNFLTSRPKTLIFFGVLLCVQFLNHTGFCYGGLRYLGNLKLQSAAIAAEIASARGRYEIEDAKEAVAAFRKEYPGCCTKSSHTFGNHIFGPVTPYIGATFGFYEIAYEIKSKIRSKVGRDYYSYYLLNSCGTILDWQGYEAER